MLVMILIAGLLTNFSRADEVVRIMAANISSGNFQSYDPGEGGRIFRGLKPDVVLIQEFNYGSNSSSSIRSFVDQNFGTDFDYYREGGDEQIPNGVISRYPIVQSGEWNDSEVSNRDFAWSRIDIPGDKYLWAVSVHLLTSSSGDRNSEATALVSFVQNHVPADDYLVIGGDFNTSSFSESALGTLSSVVMTNGRADDQNGSTGTNASRSKPYDQVLPSSDLDSLEIPVSISGHAFTYTDGLVFDSRVFTPISAVPPILAGDSAASNMQHMAVIRDFLIPTSGVTEPAAYPINFAGSSTENSLTVSWSDVLESPVPTGYLIKAGLNSAVTPPQDGVASSEDADLSDGAAEIAVASGIESFTFSNLPSDTEYYFEIYPFTDGGVIDYKTDGTPPSFSISTLPRNIDDLAAPLLGNVYFPHREGFTITWDKVVGATGYRIDLSESLSFSGGESSILLDEDFDSDSDVPEGWVNDGSANDTVASHLSSGPNCRAMGPDDKVETPEVDFPASISFFTDASGGGNGNSGTISYSVQGGGWQELASFVVSTSGKTETIDLTSSPNLSGHTDVRFRFESDFFTWYLDDVLVSGASASDFVDGFEDLAVGDIEHFSVGGLAPETDYFFRVRAENSEQLSPNSAVGTATTRSDGSPFSIWAEDLGISPTSEFSDFDEDGLTDLEEFYFATDPKVPGTETDRLQLDLGHGDFTVTYRRSIAPGPEYQYFGGVNLSTLDGQLQEGSEFGNYQIVSVERFGDFEVVTLTVETAGSPTFFFRVRASEEP